MERAGEAVARLMALSSELVATQARLDGEQVDADAGEDDQEHHRGDGGAHVAIADLQLEAEESSVEEGAENVGRIVGAGQRSLRRIDQVEGVEVADEGKDGDDAYRRQD